MACVVCPRSRSVGLHRPAQQEEAAAVGILLAQQSGIESGVDDKKPAVRAFLAYQLIGGALGAIGELLAADIGCGCRSVPTGVFAGLFQGLLACLSVEFQDKDHLARQLPRVAPASGIGIDLAGGEPECGHVSAGQPLGCAGVDGRPAVEFTGFQLADAPVQIERKSAVFCEAQAAPGQSEFAFA